MLSPSFKYFKLCAVVHFLGWKLYLRRITQMLFLVLDACCVFGVSQAFFFPPPHLCTVGDDSLECICKNRDNITISANLNFDITRIVVEGCGAVTVPLGAATHLQLDMLSFKDIDVLDIRPFALGGVQSVYAMVINDVRDFRVQPHGFVGLKNVTNLNIRNITAKSFHVGSFSGVSNIGSFRIENSYVEEVSEAAFILTNFTSFVVSNCRFSTVKDMAFVMHNGEQVLFQDCEMQETSNNTFSTAFVTSLSMVNCNFGTFTSASILTKELQYFTFKDNTVETLETDAFSFVDASETIIFASNVIKSAEKHSLIPSSGTYSSEHAEIQHCCNSFSCDCSIDWFWEPDEEGVPFYDYLIQSSSCFDEPDTNLSSLAPAFDSAGDCKLLQHKGQKPKSSNFAGVGLTSSVENMHLSLQFIFLGLILSSLPLLHSH